MDFRAIAELVWFAFLGLSVFTLTTGMVLRFVLKPLIQDMLNAYRERSDRMLEPTATERLARLEQRFLEVDGEVDELRAAAEFERRLARGDAPESPGD